MLLRNVKRRCDSKSFGWKWFLNFSGLLYANLKASWIVKVDETFELQSSQVLHSWSLERFSWFFNDYVFLGNVSRIKKVLKIKEFNVFVILNIYCLPGVLKSDAVRWILKVFWNFFKPSKHMVLARRIARGRGWRNWKIVLLLVACNFCMKFSKLVNKLHNGASSY